MSKNPYWNNHTASDAKEIQEGFDKLYQQCANGDAAPDIILIEDENGTHLATEKELQAMIDSMRKRI